MPEIQMPKLSDTMTEGTLVRWKKKKGDKVSAGEVMAEIETDKATMEWESPEDGTLTEIYVEEGGKVNVGEQDRLHRRGRRRAPGRKKQPEQEEAKKPKEERAQAETEKPAPAEARQEETAPPQEKESPRNRRRRRAKAGRETESAADGASTEARRGSASQSFAGRAHDRG